MAPGSSCRKAFIKVLVLDWAMKVNSRLQKVSRWRVPAPERHNDGPIVTQWRAALIAWWNNHLELRHVIAIKAPPLILQMAERKTAKLVGGRLRSRTRCLTLSSQVFHFNFWYSHCNLRCTFFLCKFFVVWFYLCSTIIYWAPKSSRPPAGDTASAIHHFRGEWRGGQT